MIPNLNKFSHKLTYKEYAVQENMPGKVGR